MRPELGCHGSRKQGTLSPASHEGRHLPWRGPSRRRESLDWEQNPKHRVDRAQQPVAEIGLSSRLNGVNVSGEGVNAWKRHCAQRVLSVALIACERHPTPSCWVRATPAQERERRARSASVENPRELNGAVYSGLAEFSIRYRPCIGTEAKDRGVLARKRLRERGA